MRTDSFFSFWIHTVAASFALAFATASRFLSAFNFCVVATPAWAATKSIFFEGCFLIFLRPFCVVSLKRIWGFSEANLGID